MNPSEDDDIDETHFVIKRQNAFMCFSTDKIKFLDMVNFLAPGYMYDKYLKAYGCKLQKVHFPYEYIGDVRKLDDCILPPQAAFYSRLKMKAYPTKSTHASRQSGTTTKLPRCANVLSGTTTVTSCPSSEPLRNSSPSTNSSMSICSKTG